MANTFTPGPYTPSDNQLLFRVNGQLSGSSKVTYDPATKTFTIDATGGSVIITGLPSSDPAVVGQLYTASNAVKVSTGP